MLGFSLSLSLPWLAFATIVWLAIIFYSKNSFQFEYLQQAQELREREGKSHCSNSLSLKRFYFLFLKRQQSFSRYWKAPSEWYLNIIIVIILWGLQWVAHKRKQIINIHKSREDMKKGRFYRRQSNFHFEWKFDDWISFIFISRSAQSWCDFKGIIKLDNIRIDSRHFWQIPLNSISKIAIKDSSKTPFWRADEQANENIQIFIHSTPIWWSSSLPLIQLRHKTQLLSQLNILCLHDV